MRRIHSAHRGKAGILGRHHDVGLSRERPCAGVAAPCSGTLARPRRLRAFRYISFIALILVIASCMLTGCATKGPSHKRIPAGKKPARKDVIRPAEQQQATPVAATPKGVASQRLVENGLTLLDRKNYDLAAVRFQDAINVDPRNGQAYYYLALADFYLEQYDAAVGLLDKAETLLGNDDRWVERIENLRASILTDGQPTDTAAEPI